MDAVRFFRRGEGPGAAPGLTLAFARRAVDVVLVAVVAADVEGPAAPLAQGGERLFYDVADVVRQLFGAQFFELGARRFVLVIGHQRHREVQAHRLQTGVFSNHFAEAGDGERKIAGAARLHRFAEAQQHFVLLVGGQFAVDGQQHGDRIGIAVDDGAVEGVGEQGGIGQQLFFGHFHHLRLLLPVLLRVRRRFLGSRRQFFVRRVQVGGGDYRIGRGVKRRRKHSGKKCGEDAHCSGLVVKNDAQV